jgi:predicted nucleic acid-binding protein
MSGTDKTRVYYWDACAYLAWLKNEEKEHGKDCIEALQHIAKENFEKKNVIITSVITFIEVLSASLSEEDERRFRRSFRHQDHIAYDVDVPIAMKARDFRGNLRSQSPKKIISTPDAIHLATAAIYKADEVWTFDDGKKGKYTGLLDLTGIEAVERLVIRKPQIEQPGLGI